jgi:hypothetical protein
VTSRKRNRPVSAEELLTELQADRQWVANRAEQDAKRQALAQAIYDSEAPLVADLRGAGFDVESAWELFNRSEPRRKDVPIPPWREAVPILLEHFSRTYPFVVREGTVRALTAPWGRDALERLVQEFRRTADPQVAAEEQQHAVEQAVSGASDVFSRDEVEQIMSHRWTSYRIAIATAIGEHAEQAHIPLISDLLRSEAHGLEARRALADVVRKKQRRWRGRNAEFLALVEFLRSP